MVRQKPLFLVVSLFAVGLLLGAPLANAETITYKYDALGRVIAACYGTQAKHMAFSYDPAGNRSQVLVAAACLNNPPTAVNDSVTGSYIVFDAVPVYVRTNDSDPDGDTLTVTAASCVSTGCTVAILGGGTHISVVGTTAGTKTVDYTISDGNGGTDTAQATVGNFADDPCPLC